MAISYEIDEPLQVIREVWSGDISADDLAAYWSTYLRDPRVLKVRRTIVDLRSSIIRFTGADLSLLIEQTVVPVIGDGGWKTAIVVERPVQFGVSRQYQALADLYSRDAIFYDQDAALQWLLSDR